MRHLTTRNQDTSFTDRSPETLRRALTRIEVEGWDGATATALLQFVYGDLVRPLARSIGLEGAAMSQACATGWEAAWERLSDPRLIHARSPWGVIWSSVRRAVLAEVVSASYGTSARRAWSVRTAVDDEQPRLISLAAMADVGWDLAEPGLAEREPGAGLVLGPIVAALVGAGWDSAAVEEAVLCICDRGIHPQANRKRMRGARPVAEQLGLPFWQVLRLMVLIRGIPGWPGLVERVAVEGQTCLDEPAVRSAIRSTVNQRIPSPRAMAAKATAA